MQKQTQRITIEVIESKEFRVAAKGYNQHEVDEFLDLICDEMERMEIEMANLRRSLDMANARVEQLNSQPKAAPASVPAPAPAPLKAAPVAQSDAQTDKFWDIVEVAQRVKEQTIADAQARAEQIVSDAQDEIALKLGSLEQEKEALTAEVAALKGTVADYKAQFAAVIKAAQEALDQAETL